MDKDILNKMTAEIGSLLKLSETLIKQIPEEARDKIPNAGADIRKITDSLKNGDYTSVTEIQKKYANSNK